VGEQAGQDWAERARADPAAAPQRAMLHAADLIHRVVQMLDDVELV